MNRALAIFALLVALWPAFLHGQDIQPEGYSWLGVGDWNEWATTPGQLRLNRYITGWGSNAWFPEQRLSLEPARLRDFQLGAAGGMRWTPSLVLGEGFTDNAFLQPNNLKQADVWNLVSPGLRLDFRSPNSGLVVNYQAAAVIYDRFSQLDHVDHDLDVEFHSTPNPKASWQVANDFSTNTVQARAPNADNAFYYDDLVSTGLTLRYTDRLSQAFMFDNEVAWFPSHEFNSASEDTVTWETRLDYLLFPKTKIFYDYGLDLQSAVDTPASFVQNRMLAGLAWIPPGKLRGDMGAGYQWINYRGQPANQGMTLNGALQYLYSPRTVFGVSFIQAITQTNVVAQNLQLGQAVQTLAVDAYGIHNLRQDLAFRGDLFYSSDNYGFQGTSPTVGGSNNGDSLYGGRATLQWAPRPWMLWGLSYQYQKDVATGLSYGGFQENAVMLRLTVVY